MNNTEFKWTDELVAEYSLASQQLTLWDFKRKKIAESQPKPEWEIISYLSNTTPDYVISKSDCEWNQAVLRGFKINSVKRLSDGEVFTIGDKFTANAGCELKIKEFEINGIDLKIHSVEYGYWVLSTLIKKVKEILFITEDGQLINKDYKGHISTVYPDYSFNYDCGMPQILSEKGAGYSWIKDITIWAKEDAFKIVFTIFKQQKEK